MRDTVSAMRSTAAHGAARTHCSLVASRPAVCEQQDLQAALAGRAGAAPCFDSAVVCDAARQGSERAAECPALLSPGRARRRVRLPAAQPRRQPRAHAADRLSRARGRGGRRRSGQLCRPHSRRHGRLRQPHARGYASGGPGPRPCRKPWPCRGAGARGRRIARRRPRHRLGRRQQRRGRSGGLAGGRGRAWGGRGRGGQRRRARAQAQTRAPGRPAGAPPPQPPSAAHASARRPVRMTGTFGLCGRRPLSSACGRWCHLAGSAPAQHAHALPGQRAVCRDRCLWRAGAADGGGP